MEDPSPTVQSAEDLRLYIHGIVCLLGSLLNGRRINRRDETTSKLK